MKKICSALISVFMAGVMLAIPAAADDASVGVTMKYKSIGAGAISPKETFRLVQVGDGKTKGSEEAAPKLIEKDDGNFVEVTFAEKAATKDGTEASGYFVLPRYDKEGTYTYAVAVAEGDTAGVDYDKDTASFKITVKKNDDGSFSYDSTMEANPENIYSAGTVAIKTAVAGSTGAEKFEYVIKLSAPKDKKIKGDVTITSSLGEESRIITPKDGGESELSVSVKIKNGETITFSNVPYGVAYSVTQKAAKGYKVTYTSASGTVNKDTPAPVAVFTNTSIPTITITGNTVVADYDGKTHGASGYTVSGTLADGHKIKDGSVVISGSAVNAGEYTGVLAPSGAVIVDANGSDVTADYYLDYVNGNITINRRVVVITANDNTVSYDGKAHGGNGYTISGVSGKENTGLLPGHEVKNVVLSGEKTAEGTYENGLIPSGAQIFEGANDVTANYEIAYVSGKLTITHVHEWGEPTYEWTCSTDGKGYICTATRTCKNDSSHKETETAAATYAVVTAAECEKDGLGRYTAVFTNGAFIKQTKDIAIAKLGHEYRKNLSYDKTGHWNTCAHCKAKFNFHSHNFTEWRTVFDSKGKDTDEEIRYCKDCNYYEESRTIHIKPDNGNKRHEENPNTGAEVVSFAPLTAIAVCTAAAAVFGKKK